MRVEKFYIKKASAKLASPESICLDVKLRVIFSSGCFVVKAFNIIGILRPGVSQRYREFHYILGECIHLWDMVESGSV